MSFRRITGFNLIELTVFIVVISIAFTTLVTSFQTLLQKSPVPNRLSTAIGLAQGRMDLILGQRYEQGFSSFIDPCTNAIPPTVCTAIAGYTVTATITNTTINGDSNYKIIAVVVRGLGNTTLKTLVGSP